MRYVFPKQGTTTLDPVTLGPRPSSLTTNEWLTTKEAAEYLRLTVGALRNLTSNGQVPYRKLGNRNRYWLPELRELLLSQPRRGS